MLTPYRHHAGRVAGQVVKVPLFPNGSLDAGTAHAITLFKDTEPSFATTASGTP